LAADYTDCAAPITFTNGLRTPTQPTSFNGGTQFSYSYIISDGVSYTVMTNLTVTTSSAFATTTDQLSNADQHVLELAGTRLYTYLTTGSTVNSHIISTASTYPIRFYPYALLSSSPGVYTQGTTPFLDAE